MMCSDEMMDRSSSPRSSSPRSDNEEPINEMVKEVLNTEFKKAKAVTALKIVRPTLQQVIALQDISGYWPGSSKALFDQFTLNNDCFDFDTAAALDKAIADGNMTDKRLEIIATIVALFILMEVFDEKEAEWTLVAKKAKNWLKQ